MSLHDTTIIALQSIIYSKSTFESFIIHLFLYSVSHSHKLQKLVTLYFFPFLVYSCRHHYVFQNFQQSLIGLIYFVLLVFDKSPPLLLCSFHGILSNCHYNTISLVSNLYFIYKGVVLYSLTYRRFSIRFFYCF